MNEILGIRFKIFEKLELPNTLKNQIEGIRP